MNEFLTNLKHQAEANPLLALAAGAALLTAVTRLLGASVDARNARVWSKEVSRRLMKDSIKK